MTALPINTTKPSKTSKAKNLLIGTVATIGLIGAGAYLGTIGCDNNTTSKPTSTTQPGFIIYESLWKNGEPVSKSDGKYTLKNADQKVVYLHQADGSNDVFTMNLCQVKGKVESHMYSRIHDADGSGKIGDNPKDSFTFFKAGAPEYAMSEAPDNYARVTYTPDAIFNYKDVSDNITATYPASAPKAALKAQTALAPQAVTIDEVVDANMAKGLRDTMMNRATHEYRTIRLYAFQNQPRE